MLIGSLEVLFLIEVWSFDVGSALFRVVRIGG